MYDRNFNLILYSLKRFWKKYSILKFAWLNEMKWNGKLNRISGRIPDIKKGRISGQPDIRYNLIFNWYFVARIKAKNSAFGIFIGNPTSLLNQSVF